MGLKWRTIHTFSEGEFTVSVREYPDGGGFRVAVTYLGNDGKTGQLQLFELICLSFEAALQLAKLLKVSSAMAAHLETGGTVDKWETFTRLPHATN